MSKVVVVTSGKGGVGKTTTSASLAFGLAAKGEKTVVIDFDIGLRNLDVVMGVERRVVYDLTNVVLGEATLNQALIKDKRNENLYILPASQTRDKDVLTEDGVEKVINELKTKFNYIICDSPAGIERGAMLALYFADEAIVTTNPEISSVRDSDRILGILDSSSKRAKEGSDPIKQHLLITRYNEARAMDETQLNVTDVREILGNDLNLIGVIPDSPAVVDASNKGEPVICGDSLAADTYRDAVLRLLGSEVPFRDLSEKKGFLSRLFGG